MPTTTPDCDDRVDRASYHKFAELVLDYERGKVGLLKTTDIARQRRVSMHTAYRWMAVLQSLLGLRTDRDGYWIKPPEN